eukprot:CAMPEP_0205807324 /NCGR_PEP_ID=MMETSP0205-20121125/11052_1 /ASSEMBLY_ACC=CAM_ASM_000278 /TAXON_ID=36767 /ORGANISM="Euplotes focardii, Strain TN1" /LENGTH=78 /DNA_ID=CAMNT_0053081437 /DNA_START=247 /DNA_END=480 /DNA_ORIENTATION=-
MTNKPKNYMRRVNKAFDSALEQINHSRMLRNNNGQLSKALSEAYQDKLEEVAEENKEVRKVISEYQQDVLNPDPKMIR